MSDLTPDQTEAVRHALADARATEPLPADVAARLDHALDGLYAERATAIPVVASLEARRRRRNATRMLVAAAAVVVGGFGVDAMVGHDVLGGMSADNAGGSEIDRDGVRAPVATSAQPPTDSNFGEGNTSAPGPVVGTDGLGGLIDAPNVPQAGGAYKGFFSTNLYELRRDSLTKDAASVVRLSELIEAALTRCVTPADGESVLLVRYDGHPAALRVRLPHGNEQLVDLYYCPTGHSGRLLRTIRLSAR